jgi:hypothetical protein
MISNGQKLLAEYLVALTKVHPEMDAHPEWANGLEIDMLWPKFDLAVEFQGHGHFSPVFGRREFKIQQANDRAKVILCERAGIVLVRIQICELQHPHIVDLMLRRFMQSYGGQAGAQRFFQIAGENPISRPELSVYNKFFADYRRTQITRHAAKSAPATSQERRLLKRAMARRVA